MSKSLIALLSSHRSAANVVWNLLGGAWLGILIVLTTPWYVFRLGFDGYGILSFWLVMQVVMGFLDFGMGATLVREFADSRAQKNREFKHDLVRTLEIVYWIVSGLLILALVFGARGISEHWLKAGTLPKAYVADALQFMAIALGFQFPSALYMNGLAGLQEQGRMNTLQIAGNTLRYGSGATVLLWRPDLTSFFAIQAAVAAAQTLATRAMLWKMLSEGTASMPTFRLGMLRPLWRYSFGMALTSVAAALMANADRIVLSNMVSTAELGKYGVAFTATGLLQIGIQPFYRSFFPRYSELVSLGDTKRLRDEYFRSCRFLAAVIIPSGIVGGLFAPQIFLAWIGQRDETVIEVFRCLLLGITCSGLIWLPAAFQQAHGWTRLHAAMIAGALLVGAPLMVWAIRIFGTVGAPAIWVLHGVSGITLELWLMHRRLLIGGLADWFSSVLLRPLLVSLSLATLSWLLLPWDLGRWTGLCWVGLTGLIVVATALFLTVRVPLSMKTAERRPSRSALR